MAPPARTAVARKRETRRADRPMRADAARNRQKILAAAEQVFAEHGVSVPVDVVAERAGVGIGTLYRHFPTKEDLFEAIVVERMEALGAATTSCAEGSEQGEALFSFLRELAAQAQAKRDIFEALQESGVDFKARCAASIGRVESGVGDLLDCAKAVGAVRSDVTAKEVMFLVSGACQAAASREQGAVSTERLLDVIFSGLRA